jgi:hypothetical protein
MRFPSLEDNGLDKPSTMLDGYLFARRGAGDILCWSFSDGLFNRATGLIGRRERDWAAELTRRGYIVLMVDSFGPRNYGEMCSQRGSDRAKSRSVLPHN